MQTIEKRGNKMTETVTIDHRLIAVRLFNETWDLIEKKDRTGDDDSQMLEKAYASLYHWRQVVTIIF